ncbi:unnamed protein product [Moneuplotes crassus]|uniref:Uncharacterized protein n=1 Tax=Euplotes crassus TaxID=5936 RepID=A0AAD1Y6L5_EUPCR|nr:unnamed protein product [Moneuplotes crassus]
MVYLRVLLKSKIDTYNKPVSSFRCIPVILLSDSKEVIYFLRYSPIKDIIFRHGNLYSCCKYQVSRQILVLALNGTYHQ